MNRRTRFFIMLGLVSGLFLVFLVQRITHEEEIASPLSLLPPATRSVPFVPSPLTPPPFTPTSSPLPVPPTAPPPITTATLEAIRAVRPTATPPAPAGIRLPYISPATWRGWALRILAVAGVLALIGLRLRRHQ